MFPHACAHGFPSKWAGMGPAGRYNLRPVLLRQLRAHIGVEGKIKRPHLFPQSVNLGTELIRRHVISPAPEHAGVFESQFARTLV